MDSQNWAYLNKSAWVPVRTRTNSSPALLQSHISSQSGLTWHSHEWFHGKPTNR